MSSCPPCERQPEHDQPPGLSVASQLFPLHCFKSKVEDGAVWPPGSTLRLTCQNTGGRDCSSSNTQESRGTIRDLLLQTWRKEKVQRGGRLGASGSFLLTFSPRFHVQEVSLSVSLGVGQETKARGQLAFLIKSPKAPLTDLPGSVG